MPEPTLFTIGKVACTSGVIKALACYPIDLEGAIARYITGDWGDLCDADKRANDAAVMDGESRILAAYDLAEGVRFYIITDSTRSITTIMLSSEY